MIFSDVLLFLRFREHILVYSNAILCNLAKWPHSPSVCFCVCVSVCICLYVCIYVYVCVYVYTCEFCCMNFYLFRCFVALQILGPCFIYLKEILSDLANWPNISICIHTSVHFFKIWIYDCVCNIIFKCPNAIFRCFIVLIISRAYFGIFEWDSVGPREVAKQFMCVFVPVYVCVYVYAFVYMCIYVCMCTHVCMYLYIFVSFAMFCCSCNFRTMFRNLKEIFSELTNWPNISIGIHASIHFFKIWNYNCVWNNIFDVLLFLQFREHILVYSNLIVWDLAKWTYSPCVFSCVFVCVCVYMFVYMCMYVCMCTHVSMYLYIFLYFPMFCCSWNFRTMFRYISMRFSRISQIGQIFQSVSMLVSTFSKFEIITVSEIIFSMFCCSYNFENIF